MVTHGITAGAYDGVSLVMNTVASADDPRPAVDAILPADTVRAAARMLRSWPDYACTPSPRLDALARSRGIAMLAIKDESHRFGRGGVKALGAPYGLLTSLVDRLAPHANRDAASWHAAADRILMGRDRTACAPYTAIAATDGNHGLALAWAAAQFGCSALIYVGRGARATRLERITAAGARLIVVDGTYDDAVDAAEQAAGDDPANLLITDTDYEGHLAVTRRIMAGYALLGLELVYAAWTPEPTHLFLPTGVGGMAAGVVAGILMASPRALPTIVTVEPHAAGCVAESLAARRPISVGGDLESMMDGLSCGRPSRPAFDILALTATAALTIPDTAARAAQARLADPIAGDQAVDAGDTGVAAPAGLLAALADPACRRTLGLGPDSHVIAVNSEGG